ncbi:MAG: CapA family protein [Bacillota bacterium]
MTSREGKDIKLNLTGDSLITRRLRPYSEPQFSRMLKRIRSADAAFTNLEGLLTNFEGYPAAQSGGTYVVGAPEIADDLLWAGFNLFSRANNHSMDWSFDGLLATSRELDFRGMVHSGVGLNLALARSPAYLDTAAGRVALVSTSSTFPAGGHAGKQRADLPGRPGLNPLRFRTRYEVPEEELDGLREISERLGLEEAKRRTEAMRGRAPEANFTFGPAEFVASEDGEYRVVTEPNDEDLEGNLRAISEASRQADWVIFSVHSHEPDPADPRAPGDFYRTAARRAIEAGADVVVGHGPHHMRGIEFHEGRPIFYSLGNFIFQNETVQWLPQDFYDTFGLSTEDTPATAFDVRTGEDSHGFPAHPMYWQAVMAEITFRDRELARVELMPVSLGYGKPRTLRGRPKFAEGDEFDEIVADIAERSEPFGVDIGGRTDDGVEVELP